MTHRWIRHEIDAWDAMTAHLDADEEAFLLRARSYIFRRGEALPADKKSIYRFLRARTIADQRAVDRMLSENLTLGADGYNRPQWAEEILIYKDSLSTPQADPRQRLRLFRAERAKILKTLRDAGQIVDSKTPIDELRKRVAELAPSQSELAAISQVAPTGPIHPTQAHGSNGRGKTRAHDLPADFSISDGVRAWAASKGFGDLERHFEHFIGYVKANGKKYVDFDAALINAVRDDWAGVRRNGASPAPDYARAVADLPEGPTC